MSEQELVDGAHGAYEQEWFSDDIVRSRYRYWLTGKSEPSYWAMSEADGAKGLRGFVPFHKDGDYGWMAEVGLEQYLSLEEAQSLADVIWEIEDWGVRPWKLMPIYEGYEGAVAASGYELYARENVSADEVALR